MDIVSSLLLVAFGLYLAFRFLEPLVSGPRITASYENRCAHCGGPADLVTSDQCSFCVNSRDEEASWSGTELYGINASRW